MMKKKKKPIFFLFRNPIASTLSIACLLCFLIIILSSLRTPDLSPPDNHLKVSDNPPIGVFGDMMIHMLPDDLAFTVFVPTESAFQRDLGLVQSEGFTAEKINDTIAVVSRVLGFSAIPESVDSETVAVGNEVCYESLSGFELFVRGENVGVVAVNGVRSKKVDLRRGKMMVHLMDGVIMDYQFQQSVQPQHDDDDDDDDD